MTIAVLIFLRAIIPVTVELLNVLGTWSNLTFFILSYISMVNYYLVLE